MNEDEEKIRDFLNKYREHDHIDTIKEHLINIHEDLRKAQKNQGSQGSPQSPTDPSQQDNHLKLALEGIRYALYEAKFEGTPDNPRGTQQSSQCHSELKQILTFFLRKWKKDALISIKEINGVP